MPLVVIQKCLWNGITGTPGCENARSDASISHAAFQGVAWEIGLAAIAPYNGPI